MELSESERWGISPGFHDVSGEWRAPRPETAAAILAAMGAEAGGPDQAGAMVVREGERPAVPEAEAVLEDGRALRLDGRLPGDLPTGYHRLVGAAGDRLLAVAPAACVPAPRERGWGLAIQLYSVLSEGSLGIGDLSDLAALGQWSRHLGASFLLVNPLHAALPGVPQEPSPYYPSSRRFLNPLYLRIDEVPGVAAVAPELRGRLAAGGRVDRDAVYEAKLALLEAAWARVAGDPSTVAALAAIERERGPELFEYATFCALAEVHGRPWRAWPAELRHPSAPAVREFAAAHRARVDFHRWLQAVADAQLAAAARQGPGLLGDLAVGVHPDGADAWAFQDTLAQGMSVGAPPDPFNDAGQDWGLPPFDPWRLRAHGFEPLIATLRAAFRHCAGIRIDHVMGLFRLYWIPAGHGAAGGAYVRYPARELLDLVALESARAGAWVVGEDLGTVEDEVRARLAAAQVLSYRLAWFEPGPPAAYPQAALAALTTHDLPTLAGVWTGTDPMPEVRDRLRCELELGPEAGPEEVCLRAHAWLAGAGSRLVAATLEDLALVAERPNQPGTTLPSNWSRRLPQRLEELTRSQLAQRVAAALEARRG